MAMTAQELFQARKKRIEDAISLKVPDRVPLFIADSGFFAARYVGHTCRDAIYDNDILFSSVEKMILDFEPDICLNPAMYIPGTAVEAMECRQVVLPGQQKIPEDQSYQFVEKEYMKVEEYDAFLDDPTAFTIYRYLPRVFGKLAPLSAMAPLTGLLLGYYGLMFAPGIVTPDIIEAMEALCRAARAIQKRAELGVAFTAQMAKNGFPSFVGGFSQAPFDVIGDFLRGLHGIVTDMFRVPDKLLAAIDKVTQLMIDLAVAQCRMTQLPGVFIPLHKGSDGFMSQKQFEKFYWPSLKKLILALIDAGLTPVPCFEGDHASRLETYAGLPKGKILGVFDATDFRKAKDVLADTMCLAGFMPVSVLQTGTPDDVKAHAKELIDVVGKNGGFMMAGRATIEDANPDLVKVWVEFTREYGKY